MHSWWSAPLGNVRVLLVCFAGIALSSLETRPVSELKVASDKPKRKHCRKRISQEQEEKENSKKSRPFKQMPLRRAPVFLLSPGINTRGTTLPPCWIYSMSRGLVSTNQVVSFPQCTAGPNIQSTNEMAFKGLQLGASFGFPAIIFEAPTLLSLFGWTHAHTKYPPVLISIRTGF